MELSNYIETAMKSILKNTILVVLTEIKITKRIKQSNFVKQKVVYPLFHIILRFLYILGINKRQPSIFVLFSIFNLFLSCLPITLKDF